MGCKSCGGGKTQTQKSMSSDFVGKTVVTQSGTYKFSESSGKVTATKIG